MWQLTSQYGHTIINKSPWFTSAFTLGVGQATRSDKRHVSIKMASHRRLFTALKILHVSPVHPSLPPKPWRPLIFLLSVVSLFPEGPMVRIVQYAGFSDCSLSLSNLHLSFPHIFSEFAVPPRAWQHSLRRAAHSRSLPITGCAPELGTEI